MRYPLLFAVCLLACGIMDTAFGKSVDWSGNALCALGGASLAMLLSLLAESGT